MTRYLITGTNRGLGAALLAEARARGHDALGTARSGGDLTLDVTDRPALAAAAARVGPIDILINNAGIIGPDRQSTLDMDFDGFLDTLSVNTLAPLAVAQAFLPNLRQGERPRILSISSQMAWMGYAKSDRIAYRASKAALNKVMQGLATDLAPENIAVALVDPGWVQTDMGGPDADETAETVARGIIDIAEGLTMAGTGRFYRYTGQQRDF